ncbi:monovalent cation/H+ antiporter complex subunit F [Spongiactinospora sp. TRM90649]|uniref:monovalent cation/H+ antiporter complex subunit F n=1 Tax=Spongiactinospora sp. TRM90649 TaxID=3031114 RepID=UPI0023FA23A1|nr:monovalent cation/H+ antiporter complex subunit F [Spongiactinospora sp. TRM90649]MDF5756026.1 monovalent cation/H+ antiporter complex subunit F [Spongiactinospora sp. TRM90649]
MTVVVVVCGAMIGVAALLALIRLITGPTRLDRALALDVLIAVTVVGIGLEASFHRYTATLPILLVVSIVGFVGSVSVARFSLRRNSE